MSPLLITLNVSRKVMNIVTGGLDGIGTLGAQTQMVLVMEIESSLHLLPIHVV